jgi:hypothetical protein
MCENILRAAGKPSVAEGRHGRVFEYDDGKLLKEIVELPTDKDFKTREGRNNLKKLLTKAGEINVGPKFYGIGVCDNRVFYVQEKFPLPFPPGEPSKKTLNELAALLTHALSNGVTHYDLIDLNVMRNAKGELRLIDFDNGEYIKPKSITNPFIITDTIIPKHSKIYVGKDEKEYIIPFTAEQHYEILKGLLAS